MNEMLVGLRGLYDADFCRGLLDQLRIQYEIKNAENLPPVEKKRFLLVSNHPLGALDGVEFALQYVNIILNDLRQLIADLYYMEGLFKWGGEYDIALGGGFISIRNPGYLARGEVTYSDLLELFPFDNELVLCTIRGRDLKERFLESDNSNYFICCNDALVEDIDDNGIYYIVVDSYSASYKPNRLTEVERYGEAYYARDLLADYIRNGGLG